MKALIQTELYKLFSSLRTYMTFGIAIILMVIINFGLYPGGSCRIFPDRHKRTGGQEQDRPRCRVLHSRKTER